MQTRIKTYIYFAAAVVVLLRKINHWNNLPRYTRDTPWCEVLKLWPDIFLEDAVVQTEGLGINQKLVSSILWPVLNRSNLMTATGPMLVLKSMHFKWFSTLPFTLSMYLRIQSDDSSFMSALSLSLITKSFLFKGISFSFVKKNLNIFLTVCNLSWSSNYVKSAEQLLKPIMLKKDVSHLRPIVEHARAEVEDCHLLSKTSGNEHPSEVPEQVHSSCPASQEHSPTDVFYSEHS